MISNMIQWSLRNKLLVLFGLIIFCLSVSTIALSVRNRTVDRCPRTQLDEHLFYDFNNGSSVIDMHGDDYYRLSKNIIPKNYKLLLAPNFINKSFRGSVKINIYVVHDTNIISIHTKDLVIESINIINQNNVTIPIKSTQILTDKREQLNIDLEQNIHRGYYDLEITFTGDLTKKIVGLYASNLKRGGTMVASKFQPTYARQAFPCFDEPDFKATYDISLVKPASYRALSNMNEVSKTIDPVTNFETVSFATSVPMSTYLACFVICDFDFKETEINSNGIGNNFTLRSFAQKGETHKIDFAQYIGKKATEFYIKYYEVPFPLPKLDMIAIPDYVSGATEHWGLITYRETSFLVDEVTASASNKINVANTIAHELAHMWFGNLVTMKWWDEVWLNEGFASYMQVKSLNFIEPSWTMLDQFLTKTLHSVLVTDAKLSSHPIVQNVNTPDQITAIFDSISYNKGASVLRMLEGFIGEENFRLGVSDYLKKYAFGNTVTQDLLGSLEPYFKKVNPDLNLSYILDTWTRQMGYPVLTVKAGTEPNTYIITQSRFLLDSEAVYNNDSPYNYRWFIPVTYKTNKGVEENILWFSDSDHSVTLKVGDGVDWLKINNNQVGYYRVNYAVEMWQTLTQQLHTKTDKLTISDRAHLLNDAFALAEAQIMPYELALNLITYLPVEEDYVPWQTASTIFNNLAKRLLNSLAYDHLKEYVQRLIKPLYAKQNWETKDTGVINGLLRTRILSLATRYELPEAEGKVRSLFLNWLNNHGTTNATEIQPDLRDVVYFYGMKSATQSEWDKLWQIYLQEKDVQESSKMRNALASPRDTNILRRYLLLAWDEANIRSQDYLTVLSYISDNPYGEALVWDDVRSRWTDLVDRFTLNSRYLGNMIPYITSNFNTEARLQEMEAFFKRYPDAGAGESARARSLETVRNNVRWTRTNQAQVANWLQKHYQA